jgi:hypothetical protein
MTLNPQQFQQLPMFMSAREIQEQTTPGDKEPTQRTSSFWAHKRREAESLDAVKGAGGPTLAESIRSGGVQQPVELGWASTLVRPELANGHHRVAVAAKSDQLVPVMHDAGETPWTTVRHAFGWNH